VDRLETELEARGADVSCERAKTEAARREAERW